MIHARSAAIVAVAMLSVSCAGQRARENVGVPSLQLAVLDIRTDAVAGLPLTDEAGRIALEGDINKFVAAIESGDTVAIRTDAMPRWESVRKSALLSIQDRVTRGELTPRTAASLIERVDVFGETLGIVAEER